MLWTLEKERNNQTELTNMYHTSFQSNLIIFNPDHVFGFYHKISNASSTFSYTSTTKSNITSTTSYNCRWYRESRANKIHDCIGMYSTKDWHESTERTEFYTGATGKGKWRISIVEYSSVKKSWLMQISLKLGKYFISAPTNPPCVNPRCTFGSWIYQCHHRCHLEMYQCQLAQVFG